MYLSVYLCSYESDTKQSLFISVSFSNCGSNDELGKTEGSTTVEKTLRE